MTHPQADATRRALHAVAELVLAGPQHRTSGTIRLAVTPSGFRTVAAPDLAVEGVDLLVAGERIPLAGRSCEELAATAGVAAGAPRGVYGDHSDIGPAEPLSLDPDAAAWLERCWTAGATALAGLDPACQPVLWPEHFDVGILTAEGKGFGVSPGDAAIPEPYAYVSPASPRTGTFWNAPFGAARPMRELGDGLLAFFTEGRARADSDPAR